MQDYFESNPLPTGVDLVAVSGSVRPAESEYPPSEWLADWPISTLVDDEDSTATQAYGLVYYPFTVIVDGSGMVLTRHVGALAGTDIQNAVDFLLAEG